MQEIEKRIYRYLEQPIYPDVLETLLEVVEITGVLQGGLMLSQHPALIHEAVLLFEILYEAAQREVYHSYTDALLDIYSQNADSFIHKHYQILLACRSYANSKTTLFMMLPATDIIRINECVMHQDVVFLEQTMSAQSLEKFTSPINTFMECIYSSPHHPYIQTAAVIAYATTTSAKYALQPLALEILCSSLLNPLNPSPLPLHLAKYQMFYGIGTNGDFSFDNYLLNFLFFIKNEFNNIIRLIRGLENGKERLLSQLKEAAFTKHVTAFNDLIQNSLCFQNKTLTDSLDISAKTSIEYMKQLELCGLVAGYRCGRKKLYINEYLLGIILEALSNG
ncbi:MAG: hypothetical protein LBD23_14810 [Oscillospiraceae bacterium]|jgi:hypothetical protein|nr:hypothetical protein [Oscillospiraceae bacterium]